MGDWREKWSEVVMDGERDMYGNVKKDLKWKWEGEMSTEAEIRFDLLKVTNLAFI